MEDQILAKKIVFQRVILDYWKQNGRHNLPWRRTEDPWKLLMAEVLLRKTTSEQAVSIYEQLFVYSPQDIVDINLAELEEMLYPIGINKIRAAQLKEAAHFFVSRNTRDDLTDDDLRSLNGVGRYISNMVRCITSGVAAPGLDSNMIRVLTRFFGYQSSRKRPREDRDFWKFAETLVPTDHCREYNWGVLDFGADICTFNKPKCLKCPLNGYCSYFIGYTNSIGANPNE